MSEENIILFTGPVRSGKTSALVQWTEGKSNLSGFLTPVQDGIRQFTDLSTGIFYTLEVTGVDNPDDILVGKFRFRNEIFQLGKEIILNAIQSTSHYIIVDELGKLEMDDKGFEPELSTLIHHFKSARTSAKLILVVRESILNSVLEKYQFTKVNIVTIDSLHEI